jgi:hypothetical protein
LFKSCTRKFCSYKQCVAAEVCGPQLSRKWPACVEFRGAVCFNLSVMEYMLNVKVGLWVAGLQPMQAQRI